MSNELAKGSLTEIIAAKYHVDPMKFLENIKKTCMPSAHSNEDLMTFLIVANKYDLNPLIREIYAFPKKDKSGGHAGIQVIVGVDGWMRIVSNHPDFDGVEFTPVLEGDKVAGMTCTMYRKKCNRPVQVTEYLEECRQNTIPWQKWPMRMIRHKAYIQAARLAFGISGVVDEDEAERAPIVEPMKTATIERATIDMSAILPGNVEKHTPVTQTQAPAASEVPPKKRGRPAKAKVEPVPAENDVVDAEIEPVPLALPARVVPVPTQAAHVSPPAPPKAPTPPPAAPAQPTPGAATAQESEVDCVIESVQAIGAGILKLMTTDGDAFYTTDHASKDRFDLLANDRKPLIVSYKLERGRCMITGIDITE